MVIQRAGYIAEMVGPTGGAAISPASDIDLKKGLSYVKLPNRKYERL